jgi:UPF0271 protein
MLNLDAGEHDDEPEELWALCDVLSVACGGHAGDERSMSRVVEFCAGRDWPRIGAHPSYPDRANFGRVSMPMTRDELTASIAEQCASLAAIARARGQRVGWVKPHGALYHDANKDMSIATAVVLGARQALDRDVTIIGPPHGVLREVAERLQRAGFMGEGFADRATRPDGTLVPRSEPNALITEPALAAARARELAADATIDTICVHSDTPGSLAIARAVRAALDERRA